MVGLKEAIQQEGVYICLRKKTETSWDLFFEKGEYNWCKHLYLVFALHKEEDDIFTFVEMNLTEKLSAEQSFFVNDTEKEFLSEFSKFNDWHQNVFYKIWLDDTNKKRSITQLKKYANSLSYTNGMLIIINNLVHLAVHRWKIDQKLKDLLCQRF